MEAFALPAMASTIPEMDGRRITQKTKTMNSETVKRYNPIQYFDQGGSGYGQVEEKVSGDFVKIEDYQTLEKQNQDLRTELDKAREALELSLDEVWYAVRHPAGLYCGMCDCRLSDDEDHAANCYWHKINAAYESLPPQAASEQEGA